MISKKDFATAIANLKLNKLIETEDADELLLFLNRFVDSFYETISFFNEQDDILKQNLNDVNENLKSSENKIIAATTISEKKIKSFEMTINKKFDQHLFSNYVTNLNKKDEINRLVKQYNDDFNLIQKGIDNKYIILEDEIVEKKNEITDFYNRTATKINQKSIRRYKRIDFMLESIITRVTNNCEKQIALFNSKITSVNCNSFQYSNELSNSNDTIKNYYTSISLAVNKKIKELNAIHNEMIEVAKDEYQQSLIPLSNNKEYLESSTNSTKNDILYKYSAIVENINNEFDKQKAKIEENKRFFEDEYQFRISKNENNSSLELKKLDKEIEKCDIRIEYEREKWRIEIEKYNAFRKFEIHKADLIYQTNLRKLEISKDDRTQRHENRLKLLSMKHSLIVLPYEMKRELASRLRDVLTRFGEVDHNILVQKNTLLLMKVEKLREKIKIQFERDIAVYNAKANYLKEKIRLDTLLNIEQTKITKRFELDKLDIEIEMNRVRKEIEITNQKSILNKKKIDSAFSIQYADQERLLDDFLVEQERNISLRKNEKKLSNLSLYEQRMSETTIVGSIKEKVAILINSKKEYYYSFIVILRNIISGVMEYSEKLSKFITKGMIHDGYLAVNILFTSVLNDLFIQLKNLSRMMKVKTKEICNREVIPYNFITSSNASYNKVESSILSSYSAMVDSTINNFEIQFSSLSKELEKTKIKISDLFEVSDGVKVGSGWRETFSAISEELLEARMIADFNQKFRLESKDDNNEMALVSLGYNISWDEINDETISEFILYENGILSFIDSFKSFSEKDIKETHRFKFQLASLAKKIGLYLEQPMVIKEFIKMNGLKERNYLIKTLNGYHNETLKTFESIKNTLSDFSDRINGIDDNVKEYHEKIEIFSVERATYNNIANISAEDSLLSKNINKLEKELSTHEISKTILENAFKKDTAMNAENLLHILMASTDDKKNTFKNINIKYKKDISKNDSLNKESIGELSDTKTRSENRLAHILHEKNDVRTLMLAEYKKKSDDILSSVNTMNRDNISLNNEFKKRLLLEDKYYQHDVKKAKPKRKYSK